MSRELRAAFAVGMAALISVMAAAGAAALSVEPAPEIETYDFKRGKSKPTPLAAPVIARSGTLTQHTTGQPSSPAPQRQLTTATIATTASPRSLSASIGLGAAPDPGTESRVVIGLGTANGTVCEIEQTEESSTVDLSSGFSRQGSQITYAGSGPFGDYDCGAVILEQIDDTSVVYDALVGDLAPTYGSPQISISSVELLGKEQGKMKLVPGVWTKFDVEVSNAETATAPAENLVVGGSGKGLKVRGAIGQFEIDEGSDTVEEIEVKLSKKKSKLKLAANVDGASAGKTLKVVAIKPPAKPVDGDYVGDSSGISFSIENGKVTGFNGSFFTTCGGFPDFPTYANYPYGFPTTKIPRNGIVNAVERGESPTYSAFLEMRIVGPKISQATFRYFGPNRCFAVDAFEAKRVKGGR